MTPAMLALDEKLKQAQTYERECFQKLEAARISVRSLIKEKQTVNKIEIEKTDSKL